ncbi:GyrI-like domain-containing protein [Sporocytophaga myxococcoides]|uniref:GyrI-like domain-containing protein n=1 Tax=Sporocytophaga myxococcoides TaxID=153721 RepID=UPI0005EE1FAF|nr:GyrI-like domain-containing protein [Sporocytophaga myxococcoides]
METLDLTKAYKTYFTAKAKPELIDIEPAQFLSITGIGDPSQKAFSEKIQALYSTAYTLKFTFKAMQKDFKVSKLEGQWWFDENKYRVLSMTETSINVPRDAWEYRLLIRMPDFITEDDVRTATSSVVSKKEILLAKNVELFRMTEGKCVQMLHIGPFSKEVETLKQMEIFMNENNLGKNGLHHEIYLSDFRKTSEDKLKTILREPVKFA